MRIKKAFLLTRTIEELVNDERILTMNKLESIKNIRYAVFDMDGTLVDSLGYWDYFWGQLGAKYLGDESFKVDPEIDRMIRTITLKDGIEVIKEKYLPTETEESIFNFATQLLEEHYKLRAGAKAGANEFLSYLKANGVKMCVASATEPKYIKYSLERCGLADFFEFVISCTEVGAGKDKPDVFLEALKRLGGNLSEACVFEDSYVALETAKKAGFMTVGIYDKNNYGHDRLKAASDFYIDEGLSLLNLIK